MEQEVEKRVLDPEKDSKKCSRCLQVKKIKEFNIRRASPDGYTYKCKECERKQVKENYKKRQDEGRVKEYYDENREAILERGKQYYREHREHLLALNKKYRTEHPEVHARSTEKRKKLLAAQKGRPFTREQIIRRDSQLIDGKLVPICQVCMLPVTEYKELQIDHIVPVGEGGLDCYTNVRVCHRECNIQRPLDGRDVPLAMKIPEKEKGKKVWTNSKKRA